MADSDRDDSGDSDYKEDITPHEIIRPTNAFLNDGSFMEMFKKMQQQTAGTTAAKIKTEDDSEQDQIDFCQKEDSYSDVKFGQLDQQKKPSASFVGKRRGGRTLPTGMVKKVRKDEPQPSKQPPEETDNSKKTDAWSQYMNEVRKYREQSCEEEGKRRPLVK